MATWRLLLVCAVLVHVECKQIHHKRETKAHLCDPVYNNTNKIQCYCIRDSREENLVRSADCYPTVNGITADDPNWNIFNELENVHKLTFTNTRGIVLKYIPTQALKLTKSVLKLEIKYASIDSIESYGFANLSFVEEITVRDNQINILRSNAFAHHRDLVTIGLDTNNIVEINRNVFVDLPALEKLYLTSNKITTIHDKAFMHLSNLRELEIDRNNLFSLNSETFSGLKKLEKLDLSSNSLEVIGDNTFLPLKNLQSLSLDGNKIQMLDEKAFHGLVSLQSLSLAHNSLKEIKNLKMFIGLKSLKVISLKGNQLRSLEPEVMAPILENLFDNISSLDVEDNTFPCDCRLDWFLSLMNNTRSSHLKLAIENLKCMPSQEIREKWAMTVEAEKNSQEADENGQANDYEYYDDTQLNGKLFYIDMRFLLNCLKNYDSLLKPDLTSTTNMSKKEVTTTTITTPSSTTHLPIKDLTTLKDPLLSERPAKPINIRSDNKKPSVYTTSRLSTVSAKPMANEYYDDHMAADEGKPDRIKAHRSIQDNTEQKGPFNFAYRTSGCVLLVAIVFSVTCLLY